MSASLSTKEAAEKLGTDPRSLRRFLRSRAAGVGTGKRYAIAPDSIAALKKDFGLFTDAGVEVVGASRAA